MRQCCCTARLQALAHIEDPQTSVTASQETAVGDQDHGLGECTKKRPMVASPCSSAVSESSNLPNKKPRCSFFGYKSVQQSVNTTKRKESPESLLQKYITLINSDDFEYDEEKVESNVYLLPEYRPIWPLFSNLWCIPATSVPVERIFSQGGLIMKPHRASMSNELLESLMFLKCNK